jgi:endonuclease/exonuclease/phosphatase family metal-dependent hydrolase
MRGFSELRKEIELRRQKKLSFFNRFIFILNLFFSLLLIFSYCSRYISPSHFWFFSFFGLAYPIFLIVNFLFVIYWLLQMRIQFVFSLIVILIGWRSLLSNVAFGNYSEANEGPRIKIMSYNSMLFDLYNWSKNKESRKIILDMLKEQSPDILCLQEFYNSDDPNGFHNSDTLIQILPSKKIHTEFTVNDRGVNHWGLATLSRYPIYNKGKILFETSFNNACIFTDLIIGSDTIRVYNIHLASVNLNYEDYKYLSKVKDSLFTEADFNSSKNIFNHLKYAFIKRAKQTEILKDHINHSPFPVIVCGDLNDVPTSFTYASVKGKLTDAFLNAGFGFGETYTGLIPFLRIDYIFYPEEIWDAFDYKKIKESITDHFPITVYLQRKKVH